MKIIFSKWFDKKYSKIPKPIQNKFDEKIIIFINNPLDKTLNNHQLHWKFQEYRSINITWDYRAIFRQIDNDSYEFIEFLDIGTHSALYT